MLVYISILSFFVSFLLVLVLVINKWSINKNKNLFEKEIERRRKEAKGTKNQANSRVKWLHKWYSKLPILKDLINNLKQSLALVGEKDQSFLEKRGTNIITGMLITFICLVVVFYKVTQNIMYTGVFLFFLWYISDGYIDYFITKSHNRLLEQFLRFISLVRQKYYEYQVVDDSVYEATQSLGMEDREMAVQGEIIYDLFMSGDKDGNISKYLESAPNPFLKMFVNFAQMTLEYGDQKVDGQSVFLMNLGFLSKNIQLELDKRNRLNYALKSMNIIVMLPLFFISPLREWSVQNFAPLGNFYRSPLGKYTEILTIIIIVISMMLLNKVSNNEKKKYSDQKIKVFMDKINLPLETKYKQKWLYLITALMISFITILSVQYGAKLQLKTKIYYEDQFLGATLSEKEAKTRLQESIEEYDFIANSNTPQTDDEIYSFIGDDNAQQHFDRIKEKMVLYHSYHLEWWQLLIIMAISIFAYYIPEIDRFLTKKMQKLDIDDEIAGFRSIIMMLMYNPRMNVEEVIEWLESYALYYKDLLHRCLLNIMSGEQEAILDIVKCVQHKEMQRLIAQLAMAAEDISLEEAFDELIQEKTYFFEQRKWQNEKFITRKIMIGQNIGFLPSYSLIILYMIVPMIITSSNELTKFFEHML